MVISNHSELPPREIIDTTTKSDKEMENILASLLRNNKIQEAPRVIHLDPTHFILVICIGYDDFAQIIISKESLEKLCASYGMTFDGEYIG